MRITAFLDDINDNTKSSSVFDRFARSIIHKLLSGIKDCSLVIQEQDQTFIFGESGDSESDLKANIHILKPGFYRACLLKGSIGAAEAYLAGIWKTDNLTNVIQVFSRNIDHMNNMDSGITKLLMVVDRIRHKLSANTLNQSKKNIQAHYDLSNAFFELFLDKQMMYSSAVFPTPESDLDQASSFKLQLLADGLEIDSSHHVIEIGSGWGGMAVYLASNFGCKVTTTTISDAQRQYAMQKVKDNKLEHLITVLDQDYRKLSGKYDRLISVEMIEAVGHEYFPEFFRVCNKLVKPGGRMVLQAITIPEQRYDAARRSVDFIQRYIFPGGCLPSTQVLLENMGRHTEFKMEHLRDIGLDYATTLGIWRTRFFQNIEAVDALGFDNVFKRLWEFYLCYCEGGFREQAISAVQMSFKKA